MKKIVIAIAICLIAVPVFALQTYEYGSVSTSTASGLTTTMSGATNMNHCFCSIETAPIRFRYDGLSSPTTTIGHVASIGATMTLQNVFEIRGLKMISSTSTTAYYTCTCSE